MDKKVIIFRVFIFIIVVLYIYYYISNEFFIESIVSDIVGDAKKKVSYHINTSSSNNYNPLVYIYNTHQDEAYFLPFTNDYSVIPTVKTASLIFKDHLNDVGISSYIESRSIKSYLNKNNLGYSGCYEASRSYLKEARKKYNFEYYIDIHRDSIKRKASLYTKNGVNYARILFVVSIKHKNYKSNLEFVNSINNIIERDYKGLSRGLYKRSDVIFNQDISPHAVLIEIGGVDNTIDEINNTLKVIAISLKEYMEKYG